MADSNPDSTAEFDEVDREWTHASLTDPENSRAIDVSGEIGENDDQLAGDLADAADIAAKLRDKA